MIRRIRTKLFLAIFGALVLVVGAGTLLSSLNLNRGFRFLLIRQEEARLAPLVHDLELAYGREGGWAWVRDRETWRNLLETSLGKGDPPREPPPPEARPMRQGRPHPPRPPHPGNPPLFLRDGAGERLAGPPEEGLSDLQWIPLKWGGGVVGELGFRANPELAESLDRMFLDQQRRTLWFFWVGMLLASMGLAAGLAAWLQRPIRVLAEGAKALSMGAYDHRLDLEQKDELGELAEDFNRLANTLMVQRRLQRQWIAEMAHELRTPIAVLQGELEALQDGIRALTPGAVESLVQETARLAALVEDLHVLSQADLGALRYDQVELDLREEVESVLNRHEAALARSGLTWSHRMGDQTEVMGDPLRLGQVLDNLMQNTLRYTHAPGALAVEVHRRGKDVVLIWMDSEPGVPREELSRLTERLQRGERSRSRGSGGAGLGLAIARTHLEAMGGRMVASPSPLGGLRWEISLPYRGGGR